MTASRSMYRGLAITHVGGSVRIVQNAVITLYQAGTDLPVVENIFDSLTGPGLKTNPFNADSNGNFQFFLASGKRIKVVATGSGVGSITWDLDPVWPDPAEMALTSEAESVSGWTLDNPIINNPSGDVVTPDNPGTQDGGIYTNPTISNPTITGWIDGGEHHWDIRKFGAVANAVQGGPPPFSWYTGTDNASPIQQAITQAMTGGKARRVFVPRGFWAHGPINKPDSHELEIFGEGLGQSVLLPLPSCIGQHAINLYGSGGLILKDFGIGRAAFDPASKPLSVLRYGVGASTGNAARFERLSVYGLASVATFLNEGAPSSVAYNCFFYNYNAFAVPTIKFVSVTDYTFNHCEIHELGAYWQDIETDPVPYPGGDRGRAPWRGSSSSYSVWLENSDDIRFFGSNIGGNGAAGIWFEGTCRGIIVAGPEIYAQDPVATPWNHIFHNNGIVDGLYVFGVRADASSHIFGGKNGAVYRSVFSRLKNVSGTATSMIAMNGPSTFEDCDIDCRGYTVDIDGGGAGTGRRSRFWNVGSLAVTNKEGLEWTDTSGHRFHSGDLAVRRIIGSGNPPSAAATSGWGTSPTVTVTGNEIACKVRVAVTSGVPVANPVLTLTFSPAFGSAPVVIPQFGGTDDGTVAANIAAGNPPGIVETSLSASTFQIQVYNVTPVVGKYYEFKFAIAGDA